MARCCKIFLAVGLSLSLGLHWCLLQSFAWATMLVERSHESSFVVALQTTFDGQHPCKLCRIVREGQKAEQKSDRQSVPIQKLETPALSLLRLEVIPPPPAAVIPSRDTMAASRTETPPLPPPRQV